MNDRINEVVGYVRVHACRLNWIRRASWVWRDDSDDTALYTRDSNFELSRQHESLIQCWFNVRSQSATLAQPQANIGPTFAGMPVWGVRLPIVLNPTVSLFENLLYITFHTLGTFSYPQFATRQIYDSYIITLICWSRILSFLTYLSCLYVNQTTDIGNEMCV